MRDLSLKIIPLLRQQHDECQLQANHFYATAEEFTANPPAALAPPTAAGGAATAAAAAEAASGGGPAGAPTAGAGAGDGADNIAAVSAL